MRSLPTISKMDPNDKSGQMYVIHFTMCICKDYNAGGITGIYYTTGVNAVRQYQDANIDVTDCYWLESMDGISYRWFYKETSNWRCYNLINSTTVNADWSNIIGGPCDEWFLEFVYNDYWQPDVEGIHTFLILLEI